MARAKRPLWPWIMGAGCALVLAILLGGQAFNLALWIGAAALIACGAVFCRSETGRWPAAFFARWWAAVRVWAQGLRGRWLAAVDQAPGYWESPPRDDTHAGYRADYERLVTQQGSGQDLTPADFHYVAQLADGLQRYGDRPLAKPPKLAAFGAFGAGGLVRAGLSRWVLIGAVGVMLSLLAACGLLWGRGEALRAERDAACTEQELMGRTSRQACRDLTAAVSEIVGLRGDVAALETAAANAAARQVIEAEASRALAERSAQRQRASQQRLRRAQHDDLEAQRAARAPDWDERLRDVTEPVDDAGPAPSP